jgi:signal transduction histidine kinase
VSALRLFSSVRARLLLLVLITALPLVAVLLVFATQSRQRELLARRESALHAAELLANDMAKVVASTEQLMRWISQFPEVQSGDVPGCNQRLEQLLANTDGYLGFLVTDANGIASCLAPRGALTGTLNTSASPFFRQATQSKSFSVAGIITGRLSSRPNLSFGYPILDKDGNVIQVIGAGLDLDKLNASLGGNHMPQGGVAMVLDASGNVVMHSLGLEPYLGQPHPNAGLVQSVLINTVGMTDTQGVDHVERAYAFAPYRLNGQPVLYAVMGYPVADLYAAADADLARVLLIIALIIVGTLLLAWLAGDVMIVQRANNIIHAARRLAGGDLSARTSLTYGSSELSQLARDFNDMAAALERNQFEQRQAQATVERNAHYLAQLNHLSQRLTPALTREEVLHAILDDIATGIGADAAAVNLMHEDGFSMGIAQSYGYPAETLQNLQRYTADQPIPGARVMQTGEPLWFESHDDFQRLYPHLSELRLKSGFQASAFIPITMTGRVTGLLALSFIQPRSFSEEDKNLLLTFASQCAQALERAHLYDAAQRSRRRAERNASYLSRLLDLTTTLSNAVTTQRVYATLLDAAMAAVNADKGVVYMRTPDGEHMRVAHAVGYSAEAVHTHAIVPLSRRLPMTEAMRTTQSIWQDSLNAFEHGFEDVIPAMPALDLHAHASIPLVLDGCAVGCIGLGFKQPTSLSQEEKDLLRAMTNQAALAVEQANLYEAQTQARLRAERSATYLERLQEVTSALSLSEAITPQEVTSAILDALMSSYGATTGAISLRADDGTLILSCARGYEPDIVATFERISLDRPVASVEAAKTGQAIWLESQDAYLARYPRARTDFIRFRDHACAVVPIQHSGRLLGVIALNFDMPRTFSPEDKSLLMTFSAQCGQALERARLYERQQEANAQLETRVAARTRQLAVTNVQLLHSRQELRELHKRMLTVIEAERERIAGEVHDELGQLLTVIRLEVGRAKRDLAPTQPAVAEALRSSLELVDQSMRSVRRIATELHPVILNDLGLETALEWQLQEFSAHTGIKSNFDPGESWVELDRERATAAFRIAQEALTNVMRHARASEVWVTLATNGRRLLLKVCDDGVGIGESRTATLSFGVRSMKERALSLGGRLRVHSAPGGGTSVLLILPLSQSLSQPPESNVAPHTQQSMWPFADDDDDSTVLTGLPEADAEVEVAATAR